jgi:telomeric repeat-binding factor 2-interacting protein 1
MPEKTVDPLFQNLPFFPSSSEPDTEDDEEEDDDEDEEDSDTEDYPDISSWVNAQVARGADVATVLDALRYTSMEPVLAKKLLKILKAGGPVPENMRGVWTEEDDRCVESQDARDVERVTTKHGDRLFQARWEYLEMARERGLVQ